MPIPFLPALKECITSPRAEKMCAVRLRLSRRETIQIRGASTTERPYLGLVRADARAFMGTGHCQCYLGVRKVHVRRQRVPKCQHGA